MCTGVQHKILFPGPTEDEIFSVYSSRSLILYFLQAYSVLGLFYRVIFFEPVQLINQIIKGKQGTTSKQRDNRKIRAPKKELKET